MYHHHQQQQQQGPQPFPSGPRHPMNQPPPIRPPADMMPPPGPYQFPRPTQLPDELESALSVRGSRDMDHRLIEHLDRLKQHQSQASAPGMSQHGNYGANICDTQPKPSMDWSNYEPPTKLFAQHTGGHAGAGLPNWNPPQREGGRGFYTPESAGTILASFGLSNEDLEALSHYPDDQLTPDTLPFILRDLQVHKKPKSSRSPEVPSLLTVTQTEGRVIDYGHASQAKDESGPQKTFKKEHISNERTVKMYPSPAQKLETNVGRQVRLEPAEPTKHGDRDYRRRSSEHHSSRSPPPRDFSAKPRHQDRDYRLEQPKPRVSTEKRSAESTVSKPHPPPNVKPMRAGLKAPGNKKLPTPTMMNDFSGVPPKVYPHTCSLCNMQCDQEQEWIGHLGTVNHTAACRHLRTKYPDWKPKLPSRDYGTRSPAPHSASRSTSWSPPPDKRRGTFYKLRGKPYTPYHAARNHPYHTKDVDARYERPHVRGGANLRRPSFREHLDKTELAGASRTYLKRPQFESKRYQNFKSDFTRKSALTKAKTSVKPGHGTKQPEYGPAAKKRKMVLPVAAHGPECLVYLTDIPKEATEQEVINLAGSFGPINNVLLMPSHDEGEDKDRGQQASVCMIKAEDAQTFANAPNLLIRDRVITATVSKTPEEQPSDADSSATPEQQGGGGDQTSEKKKGVVLIEELPESGWTEEHLKALAEPFGYPHDVIVAKQIGKAILIMPDVETAQEMVKVHTFSPASVNEHNVTVKNVHRNIGTHTPVALYNLLMHSVDGAAKAPAVGWGMLVVVSNVPQTPSSASIVHKLVSRIGTVFKTLAVNNLVICEMATGPLATAVYRHYLKFPCMIQNNPLVFSRKPDPKTPVKVIPAFLDTDKDVPEETKESPPAAEANQKETSENPEPKEEIKVVELKCEKTEEEVVAEKESPEEITTTTTTTIIKEEEPMETKTEDVVNAESTEEAVKAAPAEKDPTSNVTPKENGAEDQTVEEPKVTAPTEGEADVQNSTSEGKVPMAVSSETETPPTPPTPLATPKQTSREKSKEPAKRGHRSSVSSGREGREGREGESRERERRERERSRKGREYDERSKRDHEREKRADPRRDEARREHVRRDEMKREDPRREDPRREDPRREEMKRAWRREWERREGKRRPYGEMDFRGKRSHHRDRDDRDERHRSSSERNTVEDDFPFNLSDFVTVDEVGDVDGEASDAPTETGLELGSEPGLELELGSDSKPGLEPEPDSKPGLEPETDSKPGLGPEPETGLKTQTEESPEPRPTQELPLETEEKVQDVCSEAEEPEKTEPEEMTPVKPEESTETTVLGEEAAEGNVSLITDATDEEKCETNQDGHSEPSPGDADEVSTTAIPEEEPKDKEEEQASTPPAAEPKTSENGEKNVTKNAQSDKTLPPFDANCSVGLEYLVPMTGFFCKVCTRFFTGAKDAQIGHSKTLKHYENLEKFLQSSSADETGST